MDRAVLDQLFADPLGEVNRDGESHALVPAVVRGDRGVDSDHLAVEVDQRPAAIAGIDRGIGLDVIFTVDADSASGGADDAGSDRALQPERLAEGQHPIANLHGAAVAELGDGQGFFALDVNQGQVAGRIGLDVEPLELAAIGQSHHDLSAAADDVVVGEDHAAGIDDDSRTDGHSTVLGRFRRRAARKLVKEPPQIGIVLEQISERHLLGAKGHLLLVAFGACFCSVVALASAGMFITITTEGKARFAAL